MKGSISSDFSNSIDTLRGIGYTVKQWFGFVMYMRQGAAAAEKHGQGCLRFPRGKTRRICGAFSVCLVFLMQNML